MKPRAIPNLFLALLLACLAGNLAAQHRAPDAAPDLMQLMRSEKLNVILPRAMRANEVDMWIHAMGPDDPLGFELGPGPGVCIFTDPGSGRIERAVFGGRRDAKLFDVAGGPGDIAAYVAERDPGRIALNHSDIPAFDTISEADRESLAETLGPELDGRTVSADRLIADFLAGRTMPEIALYGRLIMDSSRIMEEQLDSIVPGETALRDLAGEAFIGAPDATGESDGDRVIRRGDLVSVFHGSAMMGFSQRNALHAYVLRENEAETPPEVRRLWEQALELRNIMRHNVKAGLSGAENLAALAAAIGEAGYIHIEENRVDTDADPAATQVFIDFHAQGRRISAQHAPGISASGWGRDLEIPLYHAFAFEYVVHMPVPAWGPGERLSIRLSDGAAVTERGVEFPAPPAQGIRAIR
ncbi:MAG: hypothetical protein OXP09_13355 [Gammaproteobacteria bacterium]|nr:hypothetical protein [Gammaproteobacteria bacterium]MDE0366550.1 hypothetical protein [Gammaproteobacteria bacterium]